MKKRKLLWTIIILLLISVFGTSLVSCAQGKRWTKDVERNGIEFSKIRYARNATDTIAIIGLLKADTRISDVPCKQGWVHFTKDWKLELFCLSESFEYKNILIPEGSWIIDRNNTGNTTVAFPSDTIIQGFPVRGVGGPKGVQATFDKSGKLKSFFPAENFSHKGEKFKKSILKPIKISSNGELKQE